jgi:N-acetylglucosamine-6-phosphate deacetylase
MPGLIDIHIHGCAGHDVMDADQAGLLSMARFLARHGVTAFLPTTLTNTHERIMAALGTVKDAMALGSTGGAKILGAHLEGPYLNAEKCGAQNPQYIRPAEADEVEELLALGCLKLVDVAPEIPANRWLIGACRERGLRVSLAHTAATYAEVCAAAALGLNHATHTYNAMTGLHHREPGALGAVMSLPEITCELIADNIHVHPAAMAILWALKGPGRLILISDSVRAAGMPEGDYWFDERQVVLKDGAVQLPDGTLAGSALTLNRGLYHFSQAVGAPVWQVWPAASLNAARALGLDYQTGALLPHMAADLILADEQMQVYLTVVGGEIVHQDPHLLNPKE